MENIREEFYKGLKDLIGDYVPNDTDLNNIVNYIYKMSVIIMKEANVEDEYNKISGISVLDREAFMNAMRSISLSASRKVLLGVVKDSFKNLRNQIPQYKVENEGSSFISSVSVNSNSNSNDMSNEASFNIDVGNIQKTDMEEVRKVIMQSNESSVVHKPPKEDFMSSDMSFDIGESQLNALNKNVPEIPKVVSDVKSDDDDDEELMSMDSGFGSDNIFSGEGEIGIELDY